MAYVITCTLSLIGLFCGILSPAAYSAIMPFTLVAVLFLIFAPIFGKTMSKRAVFWLRVVAVFHFPEITGIPVMVKNNFFVKCA